jgi:hypothetical protein
MKIRRLLSSSMLLALASCASEPRPAPVTAMPPAAVQPAEPARPTRSTAVGEAGEPCPMNAPGVAITSIDTPDGVAILFSTATPVETEREQLQQRVERMAVLHNERQERMGDVTIESGGAPQPVTRQEHELHHPPAPSTTTPEIQRKMMIRAQALAVPTPDGAKLVFTVESVEELENLRDQARWHARRLAQGECPLLALIY